MLRVALALVVPRDLPAIDDGVAGGDQVFSQAGSDFIRVTDLEAGRKELRIGRE
jgi:hypothetical protein